MDRYNSDRYSWWRDHHNYPWESQRQRSRLSRNALVTIVSVAWTVVMIGLLWAAG